MNLLSFYITYNFKKWNVQLWFSLLRKVEKSPNLNSPNLPVPRRKEFDQQQLSWRFFRINSHLALVKSPVYLESTIASKDRLRKFLNQRSYNFDGTSALGLGYQGKQQADLIKYSIYTKLLLTHPYPLELILELPPIPAPICFPMYFASYFFAHFGLMSILVSLVVPSSRPFPSSFLDFLFPSGCLVCPLGLTINLLVSEIISNAICTESPNQYLGQQLFTSMTHSHPSSSMGQQRERECFVMTEFSLILFVSITGSLLNKKVVSDILPLFPIMTIVSVSHPTFTVSPRTTLYLPIIPYSFC